MTKERYAVKINGELVERPIYTSFELAKLRADREQKKHPKAKINFYLIENYSIDWVEKEMSK